MPIYLKIFDLIFSTGLFPDTWSQSLIIPIHKKGDKMNVDNYRGITLLSCFGKLFNSIINDRITKFVKMRPSYHMHKQASDKDTQQLNKYPNLKCFSDWVLNSRKKVFCSFLDFRKVFDMVWRAGLWEKLVKHGIQGRCFNVIPGMSISVKSCISVNGKLSPLFECNMGVKQGENLSPIIFALFLNDIGSFMNNSALQRNSLTEHNSQSDTIVYLKDIVQRQ